MLNHREYVRTDNPKGQRFPKSLKGYFGLFGNSLLYNSELDRGHFCNNCLYFIDKDDCAIVEKEGPEVQGKESGVIARHGVCTLWYPYETKTF
jgi:hypothetical protein